MTDRVEIRKFHDECRIFIHGELAESAHSDCDNEKNKNDNISAKVPVCHFLFSVLSVVFAIAR